MHAEEAQAEPEAQDALHHTAVGRPREEVQGEAVLVDSGEGRVLILAESYRDSG